MVYYMKMTPIRKDIYQKYYNSFPRYMPNPKPKEVWLALFPYEQLGNMEKIRPVLIEKVKEDSVIVKAITTNPKNAKKIKGVLGNSKKYESFNKQSYLKNKNEEIPIYKLYGKIRDRIEIEEE